MVIKVRQKFSHDFRYYQNILDDIASNKTNEYQHLGPSFLLEYIYYSISYVNRQTMNYIRQEQLSEERQWCLDS